MPPVQGVSYSQSNQDNQVQNPNTPSFYSTKGTQPSLVRLGSGPKVQKRQQLLPSMNQPMAPAYAYASGGYGGGGYSSSGGDYSAIHLFPTNTTGANVTSISIMSSASVAVNMVETDLPMRMRDAG